MKNDNAHGNHMAAAKAQGDAILAAYRDRTPITAIAETLGLPRWAVERLIARSGEPKPSAPRSRHTQAVLRGYAVPGATVKSVAEQIGICSHTASSILHRSGVSVIRRAPANNPNPRKAERDAAVVARCEAGDRPVDVARELGLSRQRVHQILEQHRRMAETHPEHHAEL